MRPIREIVRRKLFKDTVVYQVGIFSSNAILLVTSVILTWGLHVNNYGVYVKVFAIFSLFNFTGLFAGGNAIVNKIAEANAGKRYDEIHELMGYYLKVLLLMGLGIAIMGGAIGPLLAKLIYGRPLINMAVRLVFLTVLLNTFSGFAEAVLRGHRLMRHAVGLNTAQLVVRLALISISILMGYGVTGVVVAHVLSAGVSSVIALVILARVRRSGEANIPGLSGMVLSMFCVPIGKYFGFAFLVSFDKYLMRLFNVIPVFLLGRLVAGDAAAGYFNLGLHIVTALAAGLLGLSMNILPYLSELKGRYDIRMVRDRFLKITMFSGLVAIVIAGGFSLVAKYAVLFVYGSEWLPIVPLIYVLMGQYVLSGFGIAANNFYIVEGRIRFAMVIKLVYLVIGFPVAVILIRGYGEMGGAIYYSALVGLMMATYLVDILYRIKKSHN